MKSDQVYLSHILECIRRIREDVVVAEDLCPLEETIQELAREPD